MARVRVGSGLRRCRHLEGEMMLQWIALELFA